MSILKTDTDYTWTHIYRDYHIGKQKDTQKSKNIKKNTAAVNAGPPDVDVLSTRRRGFHPKRFSVSSTKLI